MPIKRTEDHVDRVIKDTKKSEDGLRKKKKARKEKRAKNGKNHQPSTSERMIAPILLIITMLISYLAMLAR